MQVFHIIARAVPALSVSALEQKPTILKNRVRSLYHVHIVGSFFLHLHNVNLHLIYT